MLPGITINSDDEDGFEDETEFIQSMDNVKKDEILCLDVGGERHFVKRGLLIRYIRLNVFSSIEQYLFLWLLQHQKCLLNERQTYKKCIYL